MGAVKETGLPKSSPQISLAFAPATIKLTQFVSEWERELSAGGYALARTGGTGGRVPPIRWTRHAVRNLTDREIDRTEAEKTLAEPDLIAPGQSRAKC